MHLFPVQSEANLKEDAFTGSDIIKLISDSELDGAMNNLEQETWVSFKKFLGDNNNTNYNVILESLLVKFKMSLRVHSLYLDSDLYNIKI